MPPSPNSSTWRIGRSIFITFLFVRVIVWWLSCFSSLRIIMSLLFWGLSCLSFSHDYHVYLPDKNYWVYRVILGTSWAYSVLSFVFPRIRSWSYLMWFPLCNYCILLSLNHQISDHGYISCYPYLNLIILQTILQLSYVDNIICLLNLVSLALCNYFVPSQIIIRCIAEDCALKTPALENDLIGIEKLLKSS